MRIAYIDKNFQDSTMALINQSNAIIAQYDAQGLQLTLRQLYYQLVSRDIIPNKQTEYKRLGSIVADGRLAGLISWEAIEDRTRNLVANSHWSSPDQIIDSAVYSYRIDKWQDQEYRPEVWIEKDALTGVIAPVCRRLDVAYFSCRGYTSLSEMWGAGRRMRSRLQRGQVPVIIHLGDHDPSGIDMTRDIVERLEMFSEEHVEVERIALNRDQIDQYKPPPNPAKLTDSRASQYIRLHGRQSWELDALEPTVMQELIEGAVVAWRDDQAWEEAVARENEERDQLKEAARKLRMNGGHND